MDSANVMAATSWQQSLGGKVLTALLLLNRFEPSLFSKD
jgi:hypothetical protein